MRRSVGDRRGVLDRFLDAAEWRGNAADAGRCATRARRLLTFQLVELIEQDAFDLGDPSLFDVAGGRLKDPNFLAT